MNKEQNDIDNLVARWLSGDLSESEKQRFESWMKSYPEEAAEITALEATWKLTNNLEKPAGDSFESRWEKIADATITRRKSLHLFYKIAASLVVFAVISAIVFLWIRGGQIVIHTENATLKTVALPDSSLVTLNSASSIRYNNRLWFLKRKIELEGEAFFDVRKNGASFTVSTSIADTKVLGTSFNVKERNNKLAVSCVTGRVGVSTNDKISVILEKGNACIVQDGKLTETNFDPAVGSPMAWMKREMFFERSPLREVFEEISRFYDTRVVYSGTSATTFSGKFENASAEEVLKVVCLSSGLQYIKENDVFKISE